MKRGGHVKVLHPFASLIRIRNYRSGNFVHRDWRGRISIDGGRALDTAAVHWRELFLLGKSRIKRRLVRRKIQVAHEGAAFSRAVNAVHAAVFPFHRERAAVADVI